jgi:hypothetical protein
VQINQYIASKSHALEAKQMIRYTSSKQLSIEEFKTPFELNLDSENRWAKLSSLIPWDLLANVYYGPLSAKMGRPLKDARRVIGAVIIKQKLNLSDEETVLQIQENPYLQYFLGYSSYEPKLIFSPTLFVEIRKRLGADKFEEMSRLIVSESQVLTKKNKGADKSKRSCKPRPAKNNDDDKSDGQKPSGKMLIDATVSGQAIKFPTDLDLLNNSREKSEELIDKLYKLSKRDKKPRTYRRTARKEYLSTAKQKKKSGKNLRKAVRKQLNYLNRNIGHIESLLDEIAGNEFPLPYKDQRIYWIIQEIYREQKAMRDAHSHSISDRIVSISQPHVRPVLRGKAKKKIEFGAKLGVSLINGYAFVDTISWDAYNEAQDLIKQVENFKERFGHYPEAVLADNIYGTKKNRDYLRDKGILFSGKPLGRPKKETAENKEDLRKEKRRKKQEYRERIPIEGKFGQGKNGYRLNYIKAKLQSTSESWISSIFFVMNIVKLAAEKINLFSKYAQKLHKLILKRLKIQFEGLSPIFKLV